MDYISYKSSPAFKMIDNYIYLYHLDKFCVLPTYPDTLTDNMATEFKSTNALSRSAPVFSYINSGPRTITINLPLHRDLMRDLNKGVSNLKDNVVDFTDEDYVDTLINYLQACALPKYNVYSSGSKSVIPPMVAIRFGNTMFIKGVITSGISVDYEKPVLWNGKYASAKVSFTVSETDPYDAESVVSEGSFRGITAAFKNGIYASDNDASSITADGFDEVGSFDGSTGEKTTSTASSKKSTAHYSSSGAIHGGGGSHSFAIDTAKPYDATKSYVYRQQTGKNNGNKGYSGITVGNYPGGTASNYNR